MWPYGLACSLRRNLMNLATNGLSCHIVSGFLKNVVYMELEKELLINPRLLYQSEKINSWIISHLHMLQVEKKLGNYFSLLVFQIITASDFEQFKT